jgi:hypothetical protein
MFKVICFFVCLFLLFSCSVREFNYSTYKMDDGCDYIINNAGSIITHKGDCTNPIHKCNAVVIHDTIYVVKK